MEQKRLDKKNLLVIAIVVVLIAVAGVLAMTQRKQMQPAQEGTRNYLVVTVAGEVYEPLPLAEPGRFSITRGELVNVVEVTESSVRMHSSTCENQDCVLQGTVTMDNRADRVLQNMILCLPNEVVLELCSEAEVADLLLGMMEEAADE